MEFKFTQKASVIQTLLNKIQAMPAVQAIEEVFENVAYLMGRVTLPNNYAADNDGIYRLDKTTDVTYPVSHPSVDSSRPRLLSYQVLDMDVYEIIYKQGADDWMPKDAIPLQVSCFDEKGLCEPGVVSFVEGQWIVKTMNQTIAANAIVRFGVRPNPE